MSATLNVLCPNGRRENIKVTPNTTILQVIEEVCRKRGFEASSHDLKHGRKTLDVSTTYRFSGVPNNGKLELVYAAIQRATNTDITIALQLEGERRQLTVKSSISLADMLGLFQQEGETLCSERTEGDTKLQPVVINMRERIIGTEALNFTTLKSIGLLSGKAALRLVYQPISAEQLEKINSSIEKEKSTRAKFTACVQPKSNTANASTASQPPIINQPTSSLEEPVLMDTTPFTPTESSTATVELVPAVVHPASSERSTVTPPPDVRPKHPNPSGAASTAQPVSLSAMGAFSIFPDIVPQLEEKDEEQEERKAKQYIDAISRHENIMCEFKFPEATAGQTLYENPRSSKQKDEENRTCDRDLVIYNIMEQQPVDDAEAMEVGDDFFEVTKDDLRTMLKDLRQQNQDEPFLMTSAMREQRLERSFSHYEHAVVRFQFPSSFIIQAKFYPRETVASLHHCIKEVLNDPNSKFYLYTTPPKRELKDLTQSLIHARLVPLSIVHVGFHTAVPGDEVLKPSIKQLTTTKDHADSSAKSSLPTTHTTRGGVSEAASTSCQPPTRADSGPGRSGSGGGGGGSVPKWYKGALGKK